MVNSNFRNYFIRNAVDGWESIEKNKLANLCIEHEGMDDYDRYVSALICKYLYKNSTLKGRFGNYLSDEELDDRIVDGVLRALKYRSWLREGTSVYGDPSGPDKTINRCIKTQCQVYKRLNFGTKGKNNAYNRKIRYFTESLDSFQEDYGDYYYNLLDTENRSSSSLDYLIEDYAEKDLLNAIILDNICYQDSIKEEVTTKNVVNEEGEEDKVKVSRFTFDKRKLMKNLYYMNNNYMVYFADKYNVNVNELYNINELISKSRRREISDKIDKLLNSIRNNSSLIESLCN